MFPQQRMRRLRTRLIQPMLREQTLRKTDLIAPLFIDENARHRVPIASMPGQFRYPPGMIAGVVNHLREVGIKAVLVFGIPGRKDDKGSEAFNPHGVVQEAVRAIKLEVPDTMVVTDVCACEYMDHGHCGIVGDTPCGIDVINDPSLSLMARIAVSHAEAGADFVAPSCMLDGMVETIRKALDEEGFSWTGIMSYSTKFESALYGPFREAADSGYAFGDRSSYQIHPGNAREAVRESEIDVLEGADILMVKPAGFYLDLVAEIAGFGLPVAVYQVSGEYAMIRAAAEKGWIDEKKVVLESLICAKRAGADLIITYFAESAARWIDEEQ
jgi:porphobilinogen synthase